MTYAVSKLVDDFRELDSVGLADSDVAAARVEALIDECEAMGYIVRRIQAIMDHPDETVVVVEAEVE